MMANGYTTSQSGVLFEAIAERAGVSARTVRRLLNGPLRDTRPSIVRRAEHVKALALQMGYLPNSAAKAVATGRFHAATLLMTTAGGRSHSSLPLLQRLHVALAACDMHLNVAWLPDEQLVAEESLPKVLREWMSDGLIINYTHQIPPRLGEVIERHALPVVWLNGPRRTDGVRPDDALAGRLATQPLLARGCCKIVFLELGVNFHDSVAARRRGYTQAMRTAGRPPSIVTLALPDSARAGTHGETRADILRQWLSGPRRPDGVVTYSAWTAEPLLYAAATLGLRVPEDLAVTTIEDEPALHLGRPLTTAVLDIEALATAAVAMLRRKIDDPATPQPNVRTTVRLAPGDTV